MERHIISVLVKNSSGVLSRVSGLFSRRGFNIDSITAGKTNDEAFSRMTIVINGSEEVLGQVIKQLNKLQDVIKIIKMKNGQSVYRELVLIKVNASMEQKAAINSIANIFRSKIVDVSRSTVTIELTGDEEKIKALITLLDDFGIKEITRTGLIALERGESDIKSRPEYFDFNE